MDDNADLIELINELVESFDVYISMNWGEILAETENFEDLSFSFLKELSELANNVGFTLESPTINDDRLQLYFQPKIFPTSLAKDIEFYEDKQMNLVIKIRDGRRSLNWCFKSKFDIKFLKESDSILDLMGACKNEEDFNNRILTLAHLIDEIKYKKIKEKLKLKGNSIDILESILIKHFPHYNVKIIKNLRDIRTLRSKKYPIHSDDPRFLKVLNEWGFSIPPNWNEVYISTLEKYLESLEELIQLFS